MARNNLFQEGKVIPMDGAVALRRFHARLEQNRDADWEFTENVSSPKLFSIGIRKLVYQIIKTADGNLNEVCPQPGCAVLPMHFLCVPTKMIREGRREAESVLDLSNEFLAEVERQRVKIFACIDHTAELTFSRNITRILEDLAEPTGEMGAVVDFSFGRKKSGKFPRR